VDGLLVGTDEGKHANKRGAFLGQKCGIKHDGIVLVNWGVAGGIGRLVGFGIFPRTFNAYLLNYIG